MFDQSLQTHESLTYRHNIKSIVPSSASTKHKSNRDKQNPVNVARSQIIPTGNELTRATANIISKVTYVQPGYFSSPFIFIPDCIVE